MALRCGHGPGGFTPPDPPVGYLCKDEWQRAAVAAGIRAAGGQVQAGSLAHGGDFGKAGGDEFHDQRLGYRVIGAAFGEVGVDVVTHPDLTYSAAFIWKPSSTLSEGITG